MKVRSTDSRKRWATRFPGPILAATLLLLVSCGGDGKAIAEGDKALLDHRYDDAVALYRSVEENRSRGRSRTSDERVATALLRIASVEMDFRSEPKKAQKTLRQVAARFPKTTAGYKAQLRLVQLYSDTFQDPVHLVSSALRAIEMRPGSDDDAWVRLALAEGYIGRGDFAQAKIEADELLQRHPDSDKSADAKLLIARTYELRGAVVDAENKFLEVETAFAGTRVAVEARLGRARMLEVQDDLEEAEKLYMECLAYGGNPEAVGTRLLRLRERRQRRLEGAPDLTGQGVDSPIVEGK